jgi:hypothetical protein
VFLLRDGRVKILDFGIAKVDRPGASPEAATAHQAAENLFLRADPVRMGPLEPYNRPIAVALQLGSRLRPYEIQSAIRAGRMGEIYRERNTEPQRDVATKVVLRPSDATPNAWAASIASSRLMG